MHLRTDCQVRDPGSRKGHQTSSIHECPENEAGKRVCNAFVRSIEQKPGRHEERDG